MKISHGLRQGALAGLGLLGMLSIAAGAMLVRCLLVLERFSFDVPEKALNAVNVGVTSCLF